MSETDGPFGGIRYRLSEEPFFGFDWRVKTEDGRTVVLEIWRLDDLEDDRARLGFPPDKAKALALALREAASRAEG